MKSKVLVSFVLRPEVYVNPDLRDCYTWSFPEFLPFCRSLYAVSSFKLFPASQAY